MAEIMGDGVLWEKAVSPFPPARESGGALYKLPQWDRGRSFRCPELLSLLRHFIFQETLI